jgi:ATP-dependent DNA ligase
LRLGYVAEGPYRERRRLLERLNLDGADWTTPETFSDGDALWQAVCERGLEGVVAKKMASRYRSGERGWVKVKNRAYWRRDSEREAMQRAAEHHARSLDPAVKIRTTRPLPTQA